MLDMRPVGFDGASAEKEIVRDLGVRVAERNPPEYLDFAI